jgi:hypothetical protein
MNSIDKDNLDPKTDEGVVNILAFAIMARRDNINKGTEDDLSSEEEAWL